MLDFTTSMNCYGYVTRSTAWELMEQLEQSNNCKKSG